MYLVKAEANQIEKIVNMSIRAFETDVTVGGVKGDCPPSFDSVEWHKQMAREGHLYQAMIGKDLVGAAIVFPDETENSVYIMKQPFIYGSLRFSDEETDREYDSLG